MTAHRRGWGEPRPRSWDDGYVVDTPYTEPIATELSPSWLSMACVLHGQPPLDVERGLTWVDLGCGSGLAAMTVAAANPTVEVWGFDFNPAHVERARRLSARARLTNCTFVETTFAALAGDAGLGPDEVDVVVIHGVYSWVSPANQRALVEYVRRRLRPGGLAYVMYEVPCGWASMVPVAEAMRLLAVADGRPGAAAFAAIADAIVQLRDRGARAVPSTGNEAQHLTALATANVHYAVHEYLGAHFGPLSFAEVHDAMARARCSFVGATDPPDHLHAYWVPPPLTELVTGTGDVVLREMLRDLATGRALRRDLFRRGLAVAAPLERERWLRDLRMVGLGKALDDEPKVPVPVGEVGIDPAFYRPLLEVLAERSLGVEDVLAHHPDVGFAEAVGSLALLVSGGYAAPEAPSWRASPSTVAARRVNEVLVAENRAGADHRALVAPATGCAIESDVVEMLALEAIWRGERDGAVIVAGVLDELARQGRSLQVGDEVIRDPSEARVAVQRRVGEVRARAGGLLVRLGVC